MRFIAAITLLLFVSACAHSTVNVPVIPVFETKRPEMAAMPPDPATEPLPEGSQVPPGDWLKPLNKGQAAPDDGILLSEERAVRDGFYRLRYKELRAITQADREQWAAQRELYEWQIAAAREALKRAEPSWWEDHRGEILFISGLLVGGLITIGAGSAMTHAAK